MRFIYCYFVPCFIGSKERERYRKFMYPFDDLFYRTRKIIMYVRNDKLHMHCMKRDEAQKYSLSVQLNYYKIIDSHVTHHHSQHVPSSIRMKPKSRRNQSRHNRTFVSFVRSTG